MLVLAVGALILIDITILLVYTAVEGYRGNLVAFKVRNAENTEDIEGVSGYVCIRVSYRTLGKGGFPPLTSVSPTRIMA